MVTFDYFGLGVVTLNLAVHAVICIGVVLVAFGVGFIAGRDGK